MSISISSSPAAQSIPPAAVDAAQAASKTGETSSPSRQAKAQLNVSILQASMEVSIGAKNDALSLMYKTAIDNLNTVLKPELGDNAIENAANQDNTPEGTAGRIVSLSTGLLDAFKKNHPGEDSAGVVKIFMDTVRSGFEKGFKEAKDILQGMKVLEGDVASNISKTYDLVIKGYSDFESAQNAQIAAQSAAQSSSRKSTAGA